MLSNVKSLLSKLRQEIEASKPNVRYNEQIRILDEIEYEWNEGQDFSEEESNLMSETEDINSPTINIENQEEAMPKKGRKKQN